MMQDIKDPKQILGCRSVN